MQSTLSTIIFTRKLPQAAWNPNEDDWAGLAEAKARRKIQNRLNQRIYRRRRAANREAQRASASAAAARRSTAPVALAPKQARPDPRVPVQNIPNPNAIAEDDTRNNSLKMEDVFPILLQSRKSEGLAVDEGEEVATIGTSALIKQYHAASPHPPVLLHQLAALPASGICAKILSDNEVRRIHNYASTVLWPRFGHHVLSTDESLPSAFLRLSMTSELLLNSFIWTAALELSLHNSSNANHAVMLACQNKALKSIRQHIIQGDITDEVIFAVLALTISDTDPRPKSQEESDKCFGSFVPPLRSLGWLDYFSHFRWTQSHIDALKALVEARGGLEEVTTPGIADQVQSTDIIQSSIAITKPSFELGRLYHHVLEYQVKVIRPPRSRADIFDVSDTFKDLLLDMRMYCRQLDKACSDVETALNSWEININRNLIQYRLLSLPKGQDELCRLASLIFSLGILFPLARREPLQALIKQLMSELESHSVQDNATDDFLLWVTVLGGIAAAGSTREEYFVRKLKCVASNLRVLRYVELREVMRKFIWLDRACEPGAYQLWAKAVLAERE